MQELLFPPAYTETCLLHAPVPCSLLSHIAQVSNPSPLSTDLNNYEFETHMPLSNPRVGQIITN